MTNNYTVHKEVRRNQSVWVLKNATTGTRIFGYPRRKDALYFGALLAGRSGSVTVIKNAGK